MDTKKTGKILVLFKKHPFTLNEVVQQYIKRRNEPVKFSEIFNEIFPFLGSYVLRSKQKRLLSNTLTRLTKNGDVLHPQRGIYLAPKARNTAFPVVNDLQERYRGLTIKTAIIEYLKQEQKECNYQEIGEGIYGKNYSKKKNSVIGKPLREALLEKAISSPKRGVYKVN